MRLSDIYGFVVVRCGVSPQYFLDEMTDYEISIIMEHSFEQYKDGWEKIRSTNHAIISSQSTKPVQPKDVLPFPWDKDENGNDIEKKEKPKLSDEDRIRLLNKASI